MPPAVATPTVLTDPGFLWIAPLGTAAPTYDPATGVFAAVPVAWVPLGATTEGSTFSYSTEVEAIRVAELLDPVKYVSTERGGNMAFNLADWTLTNYRRALNGGIAALTPTSGTGSTAVYELEPPDLGAEVRSMVLWESTDATVRIMLRQTLQGGEISSAFRKAPEIATIPCTFNMEVPTGGGKPWKMWGKATRG